VPGGTGPPTGTFRAPGPESPVFWVYRDGINPGKIPVIPVPARGSVPNPGPDKFEPFSGIIFLSISTHNANEILKVW
jgi:hypothetical protein